MQGLQQAFLIQSRVREDAKPHQRRSLSPFSSTSAVNLSETVQKFLQLQGINTSHVSVLNWIRKYIGLMDKYLDKLTPKVSDTWRTDELYVKIKGNQKYLFALMDDQTRFWIAQQVADHKGTSDVTPMFREAKEIAQKKPKTLISDGANNFHDAFRKEFWSEYGDEPSPEHIREIALDGEVHNQPMERMNGEIRDREKVMRGLKRKDTPILKGYQLYHNYIRSHEALNGQTPSERAGIKISMVKTSG